MKKFNEFINEITDTAGHPSHIRLHNPRAEKLNRINRLYDAYKNLAKHMKEAGEPQEKIDAVQQKADNLFKELGM